jgi:hypothetical protein
LHFLTLARGASRIRFARDMAAEGRAFGSAPLMARLSTSRSLLGAAYHAACGRVRPERLRVACVVHVPRPDHSRILPVPPADELPAAATGAGAALGAPVRPSRPQRLGADDQQPGSIEQLRPRSERCANPAGLCASLSLSSSLIVHARSTLRANQLLLRVVNCACGPGRGLGARSRARGSCLAAG